MFIEITIRNNQKVLVNVDSIESLVSTEGDENKTINLNTTVNIRQGGSFTCKESYSTLKSMLSQNKLILRPLVSSTTSVSFQPSMADMNVL